MFSFTTRFLVSHCGRQFGKTRGSINWAITELIQSDGDEGWFVSKTYQQAKIAFNYLLKIRDEKCGLEEIIRRVNKSDLTVTFTGMDGHEKRMVFKTAERPDNLRGQPLAFLILDEAGMYADEVWSTILRPSLMAFRCRCVFIGTPKGPNWYFNLYNEALKDTENYTIRAYSSYDNPFLDHDEVKKAEEEMAAFSPAMARQEIWGEFVMADIKVFKDLHKCIVEPETVVTVPQVGHQYMMGVDIAMEHDNTAIVVVDATDMVVCHVEGFNKASWELQEIRMKQIWDMFFGPMVYMDCSNQSLIADDLEMKYGMPIDKVKITRTSKAEIVTKCAVFITRGNIKIPRTDWGQELISELNTFERSFTQYGHEKTAASSRNKDDRVIALCLALKDMDIDYRPKDDSGKIIMQREVQLGDGY
jgi:hypothetical protein